MKKRIVLLIILALVVVIALSIVLTRKRTTGIFGSGMIEVEEVDVSTKVTGQIREIKAKEGALVNQGDTLVILEHRELLAQKDQASANLQVAEQSINEMKFKKQQLEKDVARIRNLYATGGTSEDEKENIETQLEVLNTQENKAKASLKAAQAGLNLIQTQIDNAYILSPITGFVLAKNFDQGELVIPGARLFKIGNLNDAWLKIYLVEKDIGRIALGAKAKVQVDAYPKEFFEGTVTWIAKEAEFTPKNIQTKEERTGLVFAVKISIPNPNQKLLPGMPADARILENGHR